MYLLFAVIVKYDIISALMTLTNDNEDIDYTDPGEMQ